MQLTHHLTRWLIPHKHNDHRPHLIRRHGLAVVLLLVVALQSNLYFARSTAVLQPAVGQVLPYATDVTPIDLFNQTNAERAAAGLPALRLDAKLNQSAALKAQNMFAEDYWAHDSPSGIKPWYWFSQAGYSYQYAGENLARDFDVSSGVTAGWMNSPGHRANILNAHYTDIGFAVVNGTLQGDQTTLVVAHYGAPVAAPIAAATPKAAAKVASLTPAPTVVPTPVQVPEPTPAPTPLVTPRPTLVPTATPTSTPVVIRGEITHAAPEPKAYSLVQPLALTRTQTPENLSTIAILCMLLMVYVFTHMTVWRKGLRRWRSSSYRGLAAVQTGGLVLLMLFLAAAGFGKVG